MNTSVVKVIKEIEDLVIKKHGTINPSEVALATGYSLDTISDGFSRLLELYESRVSMDTNTGNIVYNFVFPLRKRGKKTFKEHFLSLSIAAYKIFKKVYKISIGVILILYTIVFALMILAVVIAASRGDNNRNGKGLGFDVVVNLFLAIINGMQLAAITSDMVEYGRDSHNMKYRKIKGDTSPKKSFIQSVYDFVFGPERVKFAPLSDAREVMAYLKQISNGKLTAGSILLLAGGTYDTAENRLAEYVGRFKGDLNITNDGILLAEFHNLQKVDNSWLNGKIIYYFDEADAPYIMNGNTIGKNIGIVFMNVFNLLVSMLISTDYIAFGQESFAIQAFGNAGIFFSLFLGIFPFIFSILFFIIPLIRIPFNFINNKKRDENLMKKKIFRGIIKNINFSATIEDIFKGGDILPNEVSLAKNVFEKMLMELQGEISISETGIPVYSFNRLSKELKISH